MARRIRARRYPARPAPGVLNRLSNANAPLAGSCNGTHVRACNSLPGQGFNHVPSMFELDGGEGDSRSPKGHFEKGRFATADRRGDRTTVVIRT